MLTGNVHLLSIYNLLFNPNLGEDGWGSGVILLPTPVAFSLNKS